MVLKFGISTVKMCYGKDSKVDMESITVKIILFSIWENPCNRESKFKIFHKYPRSRICIEIFFLVF